MVPPTPSPSVLVPVSFFSHNSSLLGRDMILFLTRFVSFGLIVHRYERLQLSSHLQYRSEHGRDRFIRAIKLYTTLDRAFYRHFVPSLRYTTVTYIICNWLSALVYGNKFIESLFLM